MTHILLAATALGTLTGLALTFGTGGAVGIAVSAGAVIAWFGVQAVRRDRRRERDKARHPSMWMPEGMSEHNCVIYQIEERRWNR